MASEPFIWAGTYIWDSYKPSYHTHDLHPVDWNMAPNGFSKNLYGRILYFRNIIQYVGNLIVKVIFVKKYWNIENKNNVIFVKNIYQIGNVILILYHINNGKNFRF